MPAAGGRGLGIIPSPFYFLQNKFINSPGDPDVTASCFQLPQQAGVVRKRSDEGLVCSVCSWVSGTWVTWESGRTVFTSSSLGYWNHRAEHLLPVTSSRACRSGSCRASEGKHRTSWQLRYDVPKKPLMRLRGPTRLHPPRPAFTPTSLTLRTCSVMLDVGLPLTFSLKSSPACVQAPVFARADPAPFPWPVGLGVPPPRHGRWTAPWVLCALVRAALVMCSGTLWKVVASAEPLPLEWIQVRFL